MIKRLIRGGLCLVNTAVIAISTSSVVVAEDTYVEGRNALNQIYWRIKANNIIYYTLENGKNAWIKNDRYRNSIINVIGKAIGDCVTGDNEFKDKQLSDIITFTANPLSYEQKHWNAVVLYNLVEYTKRHVRYKCCLEYGTMYAEPKELEKYKEISFEQIENDLINHYGNPESISKAITVIKQYDEAFGLREKVTEAMETAYTYDLPKTPAGMIKTFISYGRRAEQYLKYGKGLISQAKSELEELKTSNRREYDELIKQRSQDKDYNDMPEEYKMKVATFNYYDELYGKWGKSLDDLAKKRIELPESRLKESEYYELVWTNEENIYKNKLVNKKKVDDIRKLLDDMVKGKTSIRDMKNGSILGVIREEYQEKHSKKLVSIKMPEEPGWVTSREIDGCNTIFLAPELMPTKKIDWWGNYINDYEELYFKGSLDTQFDKHPGYTQKARLYFQIDSLINGALLSKMEITVPVREEMLKKGSKVSKENEVDKSDLFKQRHAYDRIFGYKEDARYLLDNNDECTLFTFENSSDKNNTRLTKEDPICGRTMELIDDLLAPWSY